MERVVKYSVPVATALIAAVTVQLLYGQYALYIGPMAFVMVFLVLLETKKKKEPEEPVLCRLAGLEWTQEQFCHNFMITGKQGSGKSVAFGALLDQLFENDPSFGGFWLDNTGDSHMQLVRISEKHGRKDDVILIEVAYDGRLAYPAQRMNLLKAGRMSSSIMATILADIADPGESKEKRTDFFRKQTITHIEAGIRFLEYIKEPVTLRRLKDFLCSEYVMTTTVEKVMARKDIKPSPIITHWMNEFMTQPPDQIGGVRTSLTNALTPFAADEVAEVFANDLPDTVNFEDITKGKIICVLCPSSYPDSKLAINTYLKGLFFYLGKRRYDMRRFAKPESDNERDPENLIALFLDEAQHSIAANDRLSFDTLRSAKCAFVAAMQDDYSLVPVTGEPVAKVILTKFQNRIIFRSETLESAVKSADKVGKRRRWKYSYGMSGGKSSSNRSESDDHIVLPQHFDNLPVHRCAILHTDRRIRKNVKLPVK